MLIEEKLKENKQREMFYELLDECFDMSYRYRRVNADNDCDKNKQPKHDEKETIIEK